MKNYLAMMAASLSGTDVASVTQMSAADPRSAIKAAGFDDFVSGTSVVRSLLEIAVVELEHSRHARRGPGEKQHAFESEWSDCVRRHTGTCGTV